VLGAYVPDERVIDHDREITGHLELVAPADRDPVDPRDRRLADLAQPVVSVLERPEPLPVLGRLVEIVLGPRAEIGPDAERRPAPVADDADLVVPRSVSQAARSRSVWKSKASGSRAG
jgi:hypothetical protein